mgnify:CR=1 FL=1
MPLDVYTYSGILIEKLARGFKVTGYNISNPNFNIYKVIRKQTDPLVNVGGVSEDFLNWKAGSPYEAGQLVKESNSFYRVKVAHTAGASFTASNFTRLSDVPITGGAQALFGKTFENTMTSVPYGIVYREIQDVVDLLLGYSKYLETHFGKPDEFTNEQTVWHNKDGFKRIVCRDEYILHGSPAPHYDFVYSYIDLEVA